MLNVKYNKKLKIVFKVFSGAKEKDIMAFESMLIDNYQEFEAGFTAHCMDSTEPPHPDLIDGGRNTSIKERFMYTIYVNELDTDVFSLLNDIIPIYDIEYSDVYLLDVSEWME